MAPSLGPRFRGDDRLAVTFAGTTFLYGFPQPHVPALEPAAGGAAVRVAHALSGRQPGPDERVDDRVRAGQEVWTFTPLRNLALLRADEVLPPALRNTLVFVVAAVTIEMVLGLALALAGRGRARGKGLMRTVMILPILVPPVAIGSMWKLLYNYDFGVFNQALVGARAACRRTGSARRRSRLWSVVARRRLALGAVRIPDPVRRGRSAAGRRARGGARRRRDAQADPAPRDAAAAEAGDRGGAAVPHDPRVQGVRRGVPAHVRRPRHVDRARHACTCTRSSSSRTSWATARCCRWRSSPRSSLSCSSRVRRRGRRASHERASP